jgi:hypothetical protein
MLFQYTRPDNLRSTNHHQQAKRRALEHWPRGAR